MWEETLLLVQTETTEVSEQVMKDIIDLYTGLFAS